MAQVKRAKWIEGISTSKRIVRDIAEILTTAIQDENGVVKAENWQLVYPRPFEEQRIVRGQLIQDPSSTRRYFPVIAQEERIILNGIVPVTLLHANVVETTLEVFSYDLSTEYISGVDFEFNPATNTIARIDGGAILDNSEVFVKYGTEVQSILDSVPVKVEKKLVISNPDREISATDYTIDYVNKTIVFNGTAPTDASYFAFTFTEVNGPYARVAQEKMQLEIDPLDPLGVTFRLPASAGEIGKHPLDIRVIASAISGATGVGYGGAIQYTLDEINHKVLFTNGSPDGLIGTNQRLFIKVYESTNPPANDNFIERRLELAPDVSSGINDQYLIVGATNELNDGKPHSIEIETDVTAPTLYKHLSNLDAGFEEVPSGDFLINFIDPTVTLLQDVPENLVVTFTARNVEDLQMGFKKIVDRIVLKTTTQPEQYFTPVVGRDFGAIDTAEELTMYVEIRKTSRLVNPETGLERYLDYNDIQRGTQQNNHYIEIRMFDKWDDEFQRPADAKYTTDGVVVERGAYISDWTKYAWFKDWKEYMKDELDGDPGSANVSEGIIFQEILTQGMTEEFPIQFWISTNNNRVAMVLMGDPTLDQDHFLTSFAYIGRIHPFYDKECVVKKNEDGTVVLGVNGDPVIEEKRTYFQNDVQGNFALTTGSSTLPVAIGAPPKGSPLFEKVEVAVDDLGAKIVGDLYDYTAYSYVVSYLTDGGESKTTPLDAGRITIERGFVDPATLSANIGVALRIRFRLPEEATGYRVYRCHQSGAGGVDLTFGASFNIHSSYKLVASVTKMEGSRTIEIVDNGEILPMHEEKYDEISDSSSFILLPNTSSSFYLRYLTAAATARAFEAVVRDRFTGSILDVKFSTKYGEQTANGVNDIMMFATRSGLKYQKHNPAFITTEEFIRKEKSGQSRWTGKFHLSPIYIEHSYDKQRGWLDGVMAVDDSGIEHLDELIVDKDTPNEEVYKFFRVNAPFSMFNNSPNYAYGLAIIKSSLRWE